MGRWTLKNEFPLERLSRLLRLIIIKRRTRKAAEVEKNEDFELIFVLGWRGKQKGQNTAKQVSDTAEWLGNCSASVVSVTETSIVPSSKSIRISATDSNKSQLSLISAPVTWHMQKEITKICAKQDETNTGFPMTQKPITIIHGLPWNPDQCRGSIKQQTT